MQELGEFDTKTSSWLRTPDDIRNLGGAIFGDRRFGRVFVEGCIAGLVIALVTLLFNGNGEPGIQPTWIDRVIWFLILAVVGAVNAVAVYVAAVLVNRFTNKSDKI